MGKLEDFTLFTLIVEHESISKASEALHIAKSAASRRLKLLEERYDAVLINRAPGQWELTHKGEELYQRVKPLVSDSEDIEYDFRYFAEPISGPLRVSCAVHLGIDCLMTTFIAFQKKHPEITLTLDLDDRTVDLESENYDLAIRVSKKETSEREGVIQLGTIDHLICASRDYLEKCPAPTHPNELSNHRIINYGATTRANWDFTSGNGDKIRLRLKPNLSSNNGFMLLEAAKGGLGIARLPSFIYGDSIKDGSLNPILKDYQIEPLAFYMQRAPNKRINKRMRLFIDTVVAACDAAEVSIANG